MSGDLAKVLGVSQSATGGSGDGGKGGKGDKGGVGGGSSTVGGGGSIRQKTQADDQVSCCAAE